MTTANPNSTSSRQPKGQPTGGQFAAKSNPESDLDLSGHDPDRVFTDHDEAVAFLMRDGNLGVPAGRYGRDSAECAEVAWKVEEIVSAATGEPITAQSLDGTMGMVVNSNDDIQYLLDDHAQEESSDDRQVSVAADRSEIEATPGWGPAMASTASFQQYLTALWSSSGEDGEPLDEFGPANIAQSAKDRLDADLFKFMAANRDILQRNNVVGEDIGHHFWLNRNGHGTGFWDTVPGEDGDTLSNACREFGEANLFVNDDGEIGLV